MNKAAATAAEAVAHITDGSSLAAANFNPDCAQAGRIAIAEVERLVEPTEIGDDGLHPVETAPDVSVTEVLAKTEPPLVRATTGRHS